MWELSTPFVYMRWFLFTLGKAESKAYIINGLLMVATFFVARNVFGTCACCSCHHLSPNRAAGTPPHSKSDEEARLSSSTACHASGLPRGAAMPKCAHCPAISMAEIVMYVG